MRTFSTGATRDRDEDKLDFEGFLSQEVLYGFAEYMHRHRVQADGSLRPSDNWQKGIPVEEYMKSMFRHFMEAWRLHRRITRGETIDMNALLDALYGIMFNVQGYLFEKKIRRN